MLSGRGGGSLTPEGRQQAEQLADRLAGRGIAAIHASPQLRTRETAEAVGRRLGVPVEVVPALDEIDFGAWTGRTFVNLAGDPAWDAWNNRRSVARIPGGETMAEAVARAVGHMRQAASGAPLLCVTHCDIIRGVVAEGLGLSFDNMLRFDVDPASVSTVLIERRGERVLRLNEGHE